MDDPSVDTVHMRKILKFKEIPDNSGDLAKEPRG